MIANNNIDEDIGSNLGSNISRFGCWNVRTMNGREQELVAEMEKYRLEGKKPRGRPRLKWTDNLLQFCT